MTKKEYEKKIAELQAQIDELKNTQIEETNSALPTPPHPRWKPKNDEVYYILCSDGTPYSWSWLHSCDYGSDIHRYSIGNVFRTPAEAEFAAERLKVLAKMREWAGKWDDDFVIVYSGADNEIGVSDLPLPNITYGIMRFASRNDAINCIKAVGEDRIKKYYFMIPEV